MSDKPEAICYATFFATLLRYHRGTRFSPTDFRHRTFCCAHKAIESFADQFDPAFAKEYSCLLYDEPCPAFDAFLAQCLQDGLLIQSTTGSYSKDRSAILRYAGTANYPVFTPANSPHKALLVLIKKVARSACADRVQQQRERILQQDIVQYEADYKHFYQAKESKEKSVGQPFLLLPKRIKGGIALIHGYLAAPLEVRAMGEYLQRRGYVVYGVRLPGHGTAPQDLACTHWEQWLEAVNRGYALVKTFSEQVSLVGFSTGGVLALLSAARKQSALQAVVCINAPVLLRNYVAHLVPTLIAWNTLLQKIKGSHEGQWEYVENNPENRHINYTSNPLFGIKQLGQSIQAMKKKLQHLHAPTLIIQAARDPIVDESSGQLIFQGVAAARKELVLIEGNRHGIVNGVGSEEVFDRVRRFLSWSR